MSDNDSNSFPFDFLRDFQGESRGNKVEVGENILVKPTI